MGRDTRQGKGSHLRCVAETQEVMQGVIDVCDPKHEIAPWF